ncbi:hypothetical protein V8G54_033057 [Vigna mungo]|uniref:Uncharacterized protein n=1 Tax=Vigna mungo TaxID=3915 RepID=A0AAQ3MM91_VIGMU
MASNDKTFPDPIISSAQTLLPQIPPRRKHRNPGIAIAFRLRSSRNKKHSAGDSTSPVKFWKGSQKNEISARRLAAEWWQWQFMAGDVFPCAPSLPSSRYQLANWKPGFRHYHNSGEKLKERKDEKMKSITILRSRNGLQRELESSIRCLKCSKEEATKSNPALKDEKSNKFKHLEAKEIAGHHYFGITNLLELLRSQRAINELKAAQKSSKKIVEQLSQNVEDKRVFHKCRECKKTETVLDDLKDKLSREKRSRERIELFNAKLVHELAKTKIYSQQCMTNYSKEKKKRKMLEEVCNELAMQVREDTAKLEGLLRDSLKICKEVEEEREMMEMAELLREERVQMKLADAQILLEDKYNEMVQLIAFLQVFLRSRGAEIDTTELEDAQLTKEIVESVSIKRIVELSYDFSKSDVSTFEELIGKDNTGSYIAFTSPLSNIHIESLDEVLNESPKHHTSPCSDYDIVLELTNSMEPIGYTEDQKCVDFNKDKDIFGLKSLKTGINGVCSASVGNLKRKAFLTSKQLRSCLNGGITISSSKSSQCKGVGDGCHKQKECNRRIPTSPIQNAGSSSQFEDSGEGSFKPSELLEQGNCAYNNMNPHIIRGMRGCTEWPRRLTKD